MNDRISRLSEQTMSYLDAMNWDLADFWIEGVALND